MAAYLGDKDSGEVLNKFEETLLNYKRMFTSLEARRNSLEETLQEFNQMREYLTLMKTKESLSLRFQLVESVSGYATVSKPQSVNVWLGANCMVQFSLEECEAFVKEKLEKCKHNLSVTKSDLFFLKEQITTMEVSIARIYNYQVKLRKQKQVQ